MRYFHNQGFYELAGEDYRNVLRVGREFSPDVLPPYIELVRGDRLPACAADELRETAGRLLAVQAARLPQDNPVRRFGVRLAEDLPGLLQDEQAYHLYAFATVRQCGAAWDAAAAFLSWLDEDDGAGNSAAAAFAALAAASKTLLFKLARASATGKEIDPAPAIEGMAAMWDDAARLLGAGGRGGP
jgi:hypothetical protein